jgi:hypothetical protein
MGRGEGGRVRSVLEANPRASGRAERGMRIGRHRRAGLGRAREEALMMGAGSGSGATTPHRTAWRTTSRRLPRATPSICLTFHVERGSRADAPSLLAFHGCEPGLSSRDRIARRGEGRCGHEHRRDGGGGRQRRSGWLTGARARCTTSGRIRRWKGVGGGCRGQGNAHGRGPMMAGRRWRVPEMAGRRWRVPEIARGKGRMSEVGQNRAPRQCGRLRYLLNSSRDLSYS